MSGHGRLYISPDGEVIVEGWVSALELADVEQFTREADMAEVRAANPDW